MKTTSFSAKFSRWRAITTIPKHPIWDIRSNLNDVWVIEQLIYLIDTEHTNIKSSTADAELFVVMSRLAGAICDDIDEIHGMLKVEQIIEQLACLLASMTASMRVAGIALDNGDLRRTRQWLLRCLIDHDDSEKVYIIRPSLFTHTEQLLPTNLLTPKVASFAEILYIYAHFTGQLNEITNYWFPSLQTWLLYRLPFRPELANLALILMRWAEKRKQDDRQLRSLIRTFADQNTLDQEVAPRAAVFFAGYANRNGNEDPVPLANLALSQFAGKLTGTEMVELMGILAVNLPSEAVLSAHKILKTIDVCMQDWYSTTPDELLMADRRGSHFKLIGNIMDAFITANRADLASEALGAWLMVPKDERRSDILIWLISHSPGVGWATGCCVSITESQVDLTELVKATGVLRGLSLSIIDEPDFEPTPVSRLGVPSKDGGYAIETLFEKLIAPKNLAQVYKCIGEITPQAIVPLVSTGLPPQPLMIRNIGWSLPWSVSLSRPLADREIHYVRLILTGTELGQIETTGIERILRMKNLQVDVCDSLEIGKDRFIELYSDPVPDVIWIVGHGEFVHDDPNRTRLPLPDGSFITAPQLRDATPSADTRRLLVLNICDATTTVMWGGLPEYGLGVLATSSRQAVIGHAWPIVAWPDAALFGRLLASHLPEQSFYAAYENTVRTFIGGSDAILNKLDGQAGELDTRLISAIHDRHGERLAEYTTWGSAAFLE